MESMKLIDLVNEIAGHKLKPNLKVSYYVLFKDYPE